MIQFSTNEKMSFCLAEFFSVSGSFQPFENSRLSITIHVHRFHIRSVQNIRRAPSNRVTRYNHIRNVAHHTASRQYGSHYGQTARRGIDCRRSISPGLILFSRLFVFSSAETEHIRFFVRRGIEGTEK